MYGGQDVGGAVLVFVTLMSFYGVRGSCNHTTIGRIMEYWGSNIPSNVLAQSAGDFTYVYLSPTIMSKEDVTYYCLATRLNVNTGATSASATDIYVERDLIKKKTVTYKKVENSGKITLQAPGYPKESQYIISFKNHVLVFWQCIADDTSGYEDSLVGIAVDVNHLVDTKEEVLEAKKILTKLELNTGEDLNPCTPKILRANKEN